MKETTIIKLYNKYSFDTTSNITNNIHSITFTMSNDKYGTLGTITITRHYNEILWMVSHVKCKMKGVGKLLYYHAMNEIYPCYITSDEASVSDSAKRVWHGIKQATYVESIYCDINYKYTHRIKLK